ncbi:hypothetical protein TGRH88_045820 [Toxoplasma gondii]|uniref:Uncharacterized protein n=1 Tax=Toxoplasma gondii TaxID=5811 RepID=A0A7J6K274_TOXGO|nr:hypothetical protein TGRH88_045820 [Toxoplasma gondii]
MKARIANKPSCQSFYASKFLKHPAGSTKSKVPARRNSGESNRGNNITTLEDECCSPRHSPSSRLNASSTIKPMLLPILRKEIHSGKQKNSDRSKKTLSRRSAVTCLGILVDDGDAVGQSPGHKQKLNWLQH